jgi:hypothetical protein
VFVYKVVQAHLDVIETAKYESGSSLAWNGEGHQHEKLAAADEELPPLPVPISSRGGGVAMTTSVFTDGDENLIDSEGKKDPCSGTWGEGEEKTGSLVVLVKPKGYHKLKVIWNIPHDLASQRCGFGYDLIQSQWLTVTSMANGEIGDARLALAAAALHIMPHFTGEG